MSEQAAPLASQSVDLSKPKPKYKLASPLEEPDPWKLLQGLAESPTPAPAPVLNALPIPPPVKDCEQVSSVVRREVISDEDLDQLMQAAAAKAGVTQTWIDLGNDPNGTIEEEESEGSQVEAEGSNSIGSFGLIPAPASPPLSLGSFSSGLVLQPSHISKADSSQHLSITEMGRAVTEIAQQSCLGSSRLSQIQLPWETGIMASLLDENSVWDFNIKPPCLDPLPARQLSPAAMDQMVESTCHFQVSQTIFAACVSCISDSEHFKQLEAERDAAIQKLCVFVTRVHERPADEESVRAMVGTRSPKTLIKRANSLLSFTRWFDVELPGLDASTLMCEQTGWKYLQHLQSSNAAPTKASSFLSAVRFAVFILEIGALKAFVSRRLVGSAENQASVMGPIKQAPALTLSQVRRLHSVLDDSSDVFMSGITAYMLVALYGRCRHSDLSHLELGIKDFQGCMGVLEFRTKLHKTSRAARRKGLLSILVPAQGVQGEWLSKACEALESYGLTVQGAIKGPLFRPCVAESSKELCARGISSKEISKALQFLLENPSPPVSSHSLKATLLTWCDKAGITPEDKAVLGRHARSVQGTEAIYNRDLSAQAVNKLASVLKAVYDKRFHPDALFRQFWVSGNPEPVLHTPVLSPNPQVEREEPLRRQEQPIKEEAEPDFQEEVIDLVTDSDSSESGESAASSSESEAPPMVKRFKAAKKTSASVSELWLVHARSKLLHVIQGQDDVPLHRQITACGRIRSQKFLLPSDKDLDGAECRTCRRHMR